MDERKTLWPSDYPYAKEHVFVVMTAVPASPEGFEGTERVHRGFCVSESPDAALTQELSLARDMWPGSEPCGFFSLADVERLGAWLEWSPRKWVVVRREGGAVEMDRVSAKDKAEAFGKFGSGVVGAVDGAWFERLRDEMEQIRVDGGVGKRTFAFLSEKDEAEWKRKNVSKRTVEDVEALLAKYSVKKNIDE